MKRHHETTSSSIIALDDDDVEYFDELESNRTKALEQRSQRDEAALDAFRQVSRLVSAQGPHPFNESFLHTQHHTYM